MEEFFGGDLARCAESGGMVDGSPAVAEGVEGGVNEVHDGNVLLQRGEVCVRLW